MTDSLVIIPTYNEKENIERMVRFVFSLEYPFDLLIIDDNSPDGTGDIVERLQESYPGKLHLLRRPGKQGLGTAYVAGFQYALERHYEFVFEMDCDFSHNPEDLIRLREACVQQGADLAIGSRYVTGVNVVNWPMSRVLLSYFASKYVRFITGLPVHDATAGFKCYRRRVLEHIPFDKLRFKGYAFQIEMKFLAWKMGFRLVEVPIIFTERLEGHSKMSSSIVREAMVGVIWMKLRSLIKPIPKVAFQNIVPETTKVLAG
ncbi:MAG: polyprenol monophosphomannose synthase [Flavobacteriales bacterium]|nr:polyprenol monophosphomannose synthase [Flavobacteriales bacterium]MCX7768166.1 polyprenol monophosphomannose synthase [Flavobacteriales bacterium]MDW8409118.1 polyprenol monophosphomannose synthase [Flavobacteriales bacterium]